MRAGGLIPSVPAGSLGVRQCHRRAVYHGSPHLRLPCVCFQEDGIRAIEEIWRWGQLPAEPSLELSSTTPSPSRRIRDYTAGSFTHPIERTRQPERGVTTLKRDMVISTSPPRQCVYHLHVVMLDPVVRDQSVLGLLTQVKPRPRSQVSLHRWPRSWVHVHVRGGR